MAFADTQELAVRLSLKDNLSGGLKKAQRNLSAFDRATSNTQRSLSKFGTNIQRGVAVGLAATSAGFLAVVNAASDYESAFAGVRKTVDATEPQLAKLSDAFRDMAKEIPISAAELARLGEAGGALGIAVDDLQEFVRVTALLGVTTDLTSDQAADSLGVLANVLKLTGDEYDNFASTLVALGNAGASTESQIIAIAERAGAAGELIGLSTDQVLGFSSAVASLGIEAEAGGSSLQKFFIDSTKHVANAGDELKIFAKVTGKTTKQFAKDFEKNAGGALEDFLVSLGKLDQAAQLNVLEDLGFNDIRITRTLLGLAGNTELLTTQLDLAGQAFEENSALTKEAEERFKTFDSQLQITKNVLTDIGITIGSKLLPKLTPLLQRLNDFVRDNQGEIEQFGTDLATAFGKFADAVGEVDWTPFIDGLKLSADLAKGAFDAFNALPDDFKKLILVGAGINKVTGGLVTGFAKDLGKTLFDQFAGRGASPANPLWVQSVGGLPGGGPGGKGGGLAGAAGTAALLVPPIIAAEAGAQGVRGLFGVPELANSPFANGVTGDNGTTKAIGTLTTVTKTGFGGLSQDERDQINATNRVYDGVESNGTEVTKNTSELINRQEQARLDAVNQAGKMQQAAAAIRNAQLTTAQQLKTEIQRRGERNEGKLSQIARDAQVYAGKQQAAAHAIKLAAQHAGQQTAFAIRDKDLSVDVDVHNNITTNVSVQNLIGKSKTISKYGFTAS